MSSRYWRSPSQAHAADENCAAPETDDAAYCRCGLDCISNATIRSDHFAGLDVSVKETSVCIVDGLTSRSTSFGNYQSTTASRADGPFTSQGSGA